MKKMLKLSAAVLVASSIVASGFTAHAFTLSTNADVEFVTPINVTPNQTPDFGIVETGASGRVLTLSTAGVISGADAADYISGALAGDYTVTAGATQAIDISIGNYGANGNVTPSAGTCAYNGGAAGACSLTGETGVPAGATLLVGLTMTTNAIHTDGQTAAPTFDIVVNYQ